MATTKPWQVISPQDYIAAQQNKNKPEPKAKPTDRGIRGEVGLLKTILPKIASDLGFIRKSISSLVKAQETDKKAAYFEKQRRRTEDYASKYKKVKPTPQEKKVVTAEKKSFIEQLKDGLASIFKFALLGLGAIGLSKLLNVSGVTGGLQEFLTKVIVSVSDIIQKGLSVITPIMKDSNVVDSLTQLLKKVFTFIADGISAGANIIKNIITDPENKESIGKVIVAVIGTIFTGLMSAIDVAGKVLSENQDSIRSGLVTIFVKIAEGLAGALKFTESLLEDPNFTQAIADIFTTIKQFIKTILETPIVTTGLGTVTIGGALTALAVAAGALQLAMAYVTGKLIGGAVSRGVGMATGGGGSGKAAGKKGIAGALSSGKTTAVLGALGAAATVLPSAYSAMSDKDAEKAAQDEARGYVPAGATSPVKTGTEGPATAEQKGSAVSVAKSFAGKTGADFIASMEGFAGKAYLDPPGNTKGQYSVGYGHLITEAEQKQGFINLGNGKKIDVKGPGGKDTVISKEEAKALLNSDLPKYEAIAARGIGADAWGKLNQDQRNSLTSLAYNGGSGIINSLVKNGLRDAILKGDTAGASKIIYEKGWKTSGGKFLAGLDTRRLKEATLFAGAGSEVPTQLAGASTPMQTPAAPPSPAPTQAPPAAQDVPKEEPTIVGKALETLLTGGGDFLKQIDQMTGGKLGVASGDLAKALRTRNLFENPNMIDGSTNIVADGSSQELGPIPGVFDENLLKKLT
jgi:GH24 family phage-related lysozyme (muramidase)